MGESDRRRKVKNIMTTIKEHILNYATNERYFNINDLRNYFNDKKIAEIEASYRDMSLPTDTFLGDTIQASFLISQLDFHGSIWNVYTRELRDGIRRIRSHIVVGRYTFSNAKEDASKVAFLIMGDSY